MTRTALTTLLLIGGLAALGFVPQKSDPEREALDRGRRLMAQGRSLEAAAVLEGVKGDPAKPGLARDAALLRAHGLVLGGKAAEGEAAARSLLGVIPESDPAFGRARWVLARALKAKGELDASVKEAAALAAEILGGGHKARLAGEYAALAAAAEKGRPGDDALAKGVPPDPKTAALLYQEALQALNGGKPVAALTLPRCRALIAAGDGGNAARELKALRERKEVQLSLPEQSELAYLRARGLLLIRNADAACEELIAFIARKECADSPFMPKARALLGEAWRSNRNLNEALRAWEAYLKLHPDHDEASGVRRRRAEELQTAKRLEAAIAAWKLVVADTKAKGETRARAAFEIAQVLSALARFDDAAKAYRRYLAAHPDDSHVPVAQKRLRDLLLEEAAWHRSKKDLPACIRALERFVEEYPLASEAPKVALEIALRHRDRKDWDATARALVAVRERYRSSSKQTAAQASLLLGTLEEEDRDNLEAAIERYRQTIKEFAGTSAAHRATIRMKTLEQVEMRLTTPRLFAPGEKAAVRLRTCNLSETTVRIYPVDGREVFDRRGYLEAAAATEIALVRPSVETKIETQKDERYRRVRREIPLVDQDGKAFGEGCYLVSVESDDRRCVALAVISSLRVVVKQSPHELFCWVIDATSGEPRADVDVRVLGKDLDTTIRSGKDGVARLVHEKAQGKCRVLAVSGDSVAPGLADPSEAPDRKGLAPRVAFTLDRPLYRPGSELRFHAALRGVEKGSFATPKPSELKVFLRDPRGVVLAERVVKSGDHGTVHGSFRIPKDGAVGSYTIGLEFEKQHFNETVEVQAYRKAEYRVAVMPERRVVRPAESCKVDFDVSYYFGGPLRKAPVSWSVWRKPLTIDRDRYESHAWYLRAIDGNQARRVAPPSQAVRVAQGTTVTDALGKGNLSFRTQGAARDQEYVIQVSVQDGNGQWVSGFGSVAAGRLDRFALVMAQRKTLRSGDRAELRVLTRSLLHEAVGTRGRLFVELYRKGGEDAGWGPVRELAVDTGLEGEATLSFALEEAGDYRLRFEGRDAAGGIVSAWTQLTVSGERPDLDKEARLSFERKVYRAGEEAVAHLNLPQAGRPALLCFEGERVLDYRILRPKGRFGTHAFRLEEELAPNLTVSVAFPFKGELLEHSDELIVLRYLDVALRPTKERASPGESVAIEVSTTDQNGKPRSAAVVARAVDAALEALGGRDGRDPRFVFNQDRRRHLVRTSSSFGFRYSAASRAIDEDLLAHQKERRRALMSVWEEDQADRFKAPSGGGVAPMPNRSARPGASPSTTLFMGVGGKNPRPGAPAPSKKMKDLGQEGAVRRLAFDARGRFDRKEMQDKANGLHFFADLSRSGGFVMPEPELRDRFLDVAGWWPEVVTDANGKARVTLELPGNLTTWELGASGFTKSSSIGRGSARIVVSKEVMLSLATPRFLRSGDEVIVPATVRSNLSEALELQLALRPTTEELLGMEGERRVEMRLGARGEERRPFRFRAEGAGVAHLEGSVRSARATDGLATDLPLLPYGRSWRFAREAEVRGATVFEVTIPDGAVPGSRDFRIVLESGLQIDLLDGVRFLKGYPYECLEQSVHRWYPAMLLHHSLLENGRPSDEDPAALRSRIEASCEALSAFQRNDGSFAYWPGGPAHAEASAIVIEALADAQRLGYRLTSSLLERGLAGARRLLADARQSPDARASLLLALARFDQADASVAASLHRRRQALSTSGLARLILACERMQRSDRIPGLLEELRGRGSEKLVRSRRSWPDSALESAALSLRVWSRFEGQGIDRPALVERVRALLRTRVGGTKAVAAAILALLDHSKGRFADVGAGSLSLSIDGKAFQSVAIGGDSARRELKLPLEKLGPGKHRICVEAGPGVRARARLLLSQVDGGAIEPEGNLVKIRRRLIPWRDAAAEKAEHEPGYTIVKPEERPPAKPLPTLSQAVLGSKIGVELVVTAREDVHWLVIEDPQCAGLEVVPGEVRGKHDRFERRSSQVLIFRNHLRAGEELRLRYPVYAVHTGSFRSPPARVASMYEAEISGSSEAGAIQVVPSSKDLANVTAPKPTPDELWAEGSEAFRKEHYADAIEALSELPKGYALRDEIHDQVVRTLWLSHLRLGHHREAVETHEALRLRNPRRTKCGPEDQELMGKAWMALGEPELGAPWFHRVIDGGIRSELHLADTFHSVRREKERARQLVAITERYPVDLAAATWLRLAEFHAGRLDRSKSAAALRLLPRRHRTHWREAQQCYLDLMAWQSGSALAERAARARIAIWRELGATPQVISECRFHLDRYADSKEGDAVRWHLAEALFTTGEVKDAATEAKRVHEWRAPDDPKRPSRHQAQAGHLLGKIAHVNGDYAEAVRWYGLVRDRVRDAEESYRFFNEKELQVDPVIRATTSDAVVLPLRLKNVASFEAQLYPVDLLILFAMKKSFDRLATADLAGIKPERSLEEKTGLAPYSSGAHRLSLGKLEEGAYLVMLRDGKRSAGSLVLVSSAKLSVQRNGRALRVYLSDAAGKPMAKARVRLASGRKIFFSGTTDARGMLSLEGPARGEITVVAAKGRSVAVEVVP